MHTHAQTHTNKWLIRHDSIQFDGLDGVVTDVLCSKYVYHPIEDNNVIDSGHYTVHRPNHSELNDQTLMCKWYAHLLYV